MHHNYSAISAINANQIKVSFDNGETTKIDLDEKLTDGENEVTFTYDGNEYTETVNYDATDKTAPEINVDSEQSTINVDNGADFTIPEATAEDNKDGSVEVTTSITDSDGNKVDEIDTSEAGSYIVTYTAEDEAGNKTATAITVNVAEADSLKVSDVSPADVYSVDLTFSEEADVEEADLQDTKITLNDGENDIEATYKADSLNDGKATFVLSQGNMIFDTDYTVSSEDLSFDNNTFTFETDVDALVNKAQDAINDLPAPEDVTTDNLQKAQDALANANELVRKAHDVDENVAFDTYPMDQLQDKVNQLQEDINKTVKNAQEAIEGLSAPEDLTGENLEQVQNEINDAQDLVDQAHEADENVVFDTYAIDQLQSKVNNMEDAIATAEDAISAIGDPEDLSMEDEEKVATATEKVDAAMNLGVKQDAIGNFDHYNLAKGNLSDAKGAFVDAKSALTNLPIKQNITLDDKQQVNDAKDAYDKAMEYDAVKESDFDNVWKLNDAETEIADLQQTLNEAKDATSDLEDLVDSTDKVEALVSDSDKREEANNAYVTASNKLQHVASGDTKDDLKNRIEAANDKINATSFVSGLQEATSDLTDGNIDQAKNQLTSTQGAVDALEDGDIKNALNSLVQDEADKIENFEAASGVRSLIDDLPSAENVQTSDQEQIEEARNAYDNLTEEQQELVKNVDKLTEAEDAYQNLQEEAILTTIDSLSDSNKPEQVKPTLQKLADITSDNEGDAKFDMSPVIEGNASAYLTAFVNGSVESVSDVQNIVDQVNNKVSVDYKADNKVKSISKDGVTFENGSFDVPYEVDSFTFDDGDTEYKAYYEDGKWTIDQTATETNPADSLKVAYSDEVNASEEAVAALKGNKNVKVDQNGHNIDVSGDLNYAEVGESQGHFVGFQIDKLNSDVEDNAKVKIYFNGEWHTDKLEGSKLEIFQQVDHLDNNSRNYLVNWDNEKNEDNAVSYDFDFSGLTLNPAPNEVAYDANGEVEVTTNGVEFNDGNFTVPANVDSFTFTDNSVHYEATVTEDGLDYTMTASDAEQLNSALDANTEVTDTITLDGDIEAESKVTINQSDITIDGNNHSLNSHIQIRSNDVTIQDVDVDVSETSAGKGTPAIDVTNATGATIEDNEIKAGEHSGIYFNRETSGEAVGNTINGRKGIGAQTAKEVTITDNTINAKADQIELFLDNNVDSHKSFGTYKVKGNEDDDGNGIKKPELEDTPE